MKFILDMNMPPALCAILQAEGWVAIHWSSIGDPRAPDESIMKYAQENGFSVLTHDLDFSAILASSRAHGPSVVQVRTQDILSGPFQTTLVGALRQFVTVLDAGAIVVVDDTRSKARILPLT